MLDYRSYTFLEVYRARSFSRAAKALHITQPAVSQHIRYLEHYYEAALFEKTTRGAKPTPAGDRLFRVLSTMANDEERLRTELHALASEAAPAPLRLGCTRTVADYVAPRLLAAHATAEPAEPVNMRVGNTTELVQLMDTGKIDCALVEGSFDRARFDGVVYSTEDYIAVASPEVVASPKAAASSNPRSIHDLVGERLILREPGSGTREILERNLTAHDLTLADFAGTLELASIPAIISCVAAGAGITFLYRIAVEQELAAGTLVDITPADFGIRHDFTLIWQRGSAYAARYRALIAGTK